MKISSSVTAKDNSINNINVSSDNTHKKKIFFPNLNGIRFVAAMMVLVHHVEQIKRDFGFASFYRDNIYGSNLGGLGVTLFFVLSGFLITYLLLEEKNNFRTINLKEFYIRRILRIWPLYYLIVILAFFVIPNYFDVIMIGRSEQMLNIDYYEKLSMFMFFIPNIAFVTSYPVLFAAQAWSVGVEEQFYAIWPLIVKYLNNIFYAMISIIVIFLLLNLAFENLMWKNGRIDPNIFVYRNFFAVTRIDCMAVGGLFALAAHNKNFLYQIITNKIIQIITLLTTFYLSYIEYPFRGFGHLPYALLFGIIIINLATNSKTLIKLNNNIFEYGGKISYGIYMFQGIGVVTTFIITEKYLSKTNMITTNLILYTSSTILTFAISSLSYHCYEKYFLKKKVLFSSIISGDNAISEK